MYEEKKRYQVSKDIDPRVSANKMKRPKRFFKRMILRKNGDAKQNNQDESSKESVFQEEDTQNFDGYISSELPRGSDYEDIASICFNIFSKEDASHGEDIQTLKGRTSSTEQASAQNPPLSLLSLSSDYEDDASTCSGEACKEDVSQEENIQNSKRNGSSVEQRSMQNCPLRVMISSLSFDSRDDASAAVSTRSIISSEGGVFEEKHAKDVKGNDLDEKAILQNSPICLLSVSSLGSNFGDKGTYKLLADVERRSSDSSKELVDGYLSGATKTSESSRNDITSRDIPLLDDTDKSDQDEKEKELFTFMNHFIDDACNIGMTCRQSNEEESKLYERKGRRVTFSDNGYKSK